MKRSVGYEIHHESKTIVLTKKFNQAAAQRGSKEYDELLTLKAELPDYTLALREIRKAEGKQTYRNLTYEFMENLIQETHAEMLEEFHSIKAKALAQKNGAYTYVKNWFLMNFKAEIA